MTARPVLEDRPTQLIGGRWVPGQGGTIAVTDPATERVVASVTQASAADAALAVEAAHRAWPEWAAVPVAERAAVVRRLGQLLGERADALGAVIASEVGMPRHLAVAAQVKLPAAVLAGTAATALTHPWEEQIGPTTVRREPAGVVVAITPWNMPLHQIAAKVGPALVAGCTVVVKPSEIAPLCAFGFADAVVEAGIPDGVFNLVCGTGAEVGEALVTHPLVSVVSLTGSVRSGARVAALAAPAITRVCLELGGKSANVLLDDVDLDAAIPDAVGQAYFNSGQACNALSRLVVPSQLVAEVEERVAAAVGRLVTGDPFDDETDLGPLISAAQLASVRDHVTGALASGARLIAGGPEPLSGRATGHYHRPTVVSSVTPAMAIGQEEVFGPVLAIQTYDGDDDAITVANSTRYGLSGGVWSTDVDRARAVAARLRAGQVKINGARTRDHLDAPFGGYGRSGLGRELGGFGIDEFVEIKAVLG